MKPTGIGLATACLLSRNKLTQFKSLDLIAPLQKALQDAGYTTPTPIQAQSIPFLLQGRDLLGIAQTGTGKTAAFSLPLLQYLSENPLKRMPSSPRALILSPTRELALQIQKSLEVYGKHVRQRSAVIFGGVNQGPQVKALKQGLDILVATPGRLLDLMQQGEIKLGKLEVFILDEADRMLDMGFINDVKKVVAKLPLKRQTLLFSATMPQDIASLANQLLRNPAKVEVTPQATTVERIEQKVMFVDKAHKPALLRHVIADAAVEQALVFSRTKHGADKIVRDLKKWGVSCEAIHGNKSQPQRVRALDAFRSGKLKVLIATDIAARGIDVAGVSHVINFDLPNEPESYVHRIGRTARAGRDGSAISFCDSSERSLLNSIERVIRKRLAVDVKTAALAGVAAAKAHEHRQSLHSGQGPHKTPSKPLPGKHEHQQAVRKPGRRVSSAGSPPRRSMMW